MLFKVLVCGSVLLRETLPKWNKLFVKIYTNASGTGTPILENYLSGKSIMQTIFGNSGTYTDNFKNVDTFFCEFNTKAIDIRHINRLQDTELKLLYNFVKDHLPYHNHFVIEIESTLSTCSSCGPYLAYLKKMVVAQGKTIDIKIKSSTNSGMPALRKNYNL